MPHNLVPRWPHLIQIVPFCPGVAGSRGISSRSRRGIPRNALEISWAGQDWGPLVVASIYVARSTLPMRRPTCFRGPVRPATHKFVVYYLMPGRAPLRADSSPVLYSSSRREPASTPLCDASANIRANLWCGCARIENDLALMHFLHLELSNV